MKKRFSPYSKRRIATRKNRKTAAFSAESFICALLKQIETKRAKMSKNEIIKKKHCDTRIIRYFHDFDLLELELKSFLNCQTKMKIRGAKKRGKILFDLYKRFILRNGGFAGLHGAWRGVPRLVGDPVRSILFDCIFIRFLRCFFSIFFMPLNLRKLCTSAIRGLHFRYGCPQAVSDPQTRFRFATPPRP